MAAAASPAALKFLGTAGARHVVSTQLRHSGGLVWTLGGVRIWVDPGPGALVRALASRPKIDPASVDAVLATGGTAEAVGRLVARQGAELVAFSFLVELGFLNGARRLGPQRVHALLKY